MIAKFHIYLFSALLVACTPAATSTLMVPTEATYSSTATATRRSISISHDQLPYVDDELLTPVLSATLSATSTPSPTLTATPTALNLPTPYIAIPANWETYTNNEYGFMFRS